MSYVDLLPAPGAHAAADAYPAMFRAPARRPLRVACALGGTDLGRSGIGTYVRETLPPLIAALASEGGRLTAFGHADEIAAYGAALSGADVRPTRGVPLKPGVNALWHLARASAFARKAGADVMLLPAANRRITFSAALPTVAVVHDLAQLRVQEKYDRLRMAYFNRVLLPAFKRPQRVVAVSGATRDDLVLSLGVDPDRVRVVYNGVNSRLFRALDPKGPEAARARRELGLAEKPYLLYPARLEHPGKNHVRLLRAFAQSGLARTHTLALSGADWGGGELIQATMRTLDLEHAVRFLGFVPKDILPPLVAGADGVLMLGLHEGFGLPALEGLSAGRPVCVSSTAALPEVVGPLGVQCDPFSEASIADGLRRIVHDEAVRRRCEQEGPAWAEGFSWQRTAQGLLQACHEAVASTKG